MSSRAYLALLSAAFFMLHPASAYDPSSQDYNPSATVRAASSSLGNVYVVVTVSATACGKTKSGYAFGKSLAIVKPVSTPFSCSKGFAAASGVAGFNAGMGATTGATDAGSAVSNAYSSDQLTLIPPKGFKGGTISIFLADGVNATFENTGNAYVTMNWTVLQGSKTLFSAKTGNITSPGLTPEVFPLTVPVSSKGTTLVVTKSLSAFATGSKKKAPFVTGSSQSVALFLLDPGWTCKYASGDPCTRTTLK